MTTKRILNGRYEVYDAIGVGNYGRVFEGYDMITRSKVAVKELFKEVVSSPELMKITFMEIEVLSTINHPYIIKLLDHFPNNECYCLVYEFCEKGDMKNYVDSRGRL